MHLPFSHWRQLHLYVVQLLYGAAGSEGGGAREGGGGEHHHVECAEGDAKGAVPGGGRVVWAGRGRWG